MIIVYALIGIPASLAVARALFLFCTDPGDRIRGRLRLARRRIAACFALVSVAACSTTLDESPCLPGFTTACNVSAIPNAADYVVTCFNLQTDPNACGTCGNVCASGVCIAGMCTNTSCEFCPDGGACAPCDSDAGPDGHGCKSLADCAALIPGVCGEVACDSFGLVDPPIILGVPKGCYVTALPSCDPADAAPDSGKDGAP